jgi:hypothetical protein
MTRVKMKEKPGYPDKSVYPEKDGYPDKFVYLEKDGYPDTKIAGYSIGINALKNKFNLRQNS